jgi:hypothetical protein
MTSPEAPAEFVVALNEAAERYGVALSVSDRVAIARLLAALPVGALTPFEVEAAFAKHRLQLPRRGFSRAVVGRIGQLGGVRTLTDVLVDYRRFAIDALSAEFGGGRSNGREESLRNNLRTYLTTHAEVEARTGRGKTDLYIPELDTVIEVKIWTDQSTFDAGVEELGRYIHTKRPKAAVMVVFGDREPLPAIAKSHTGPFSTPLRLEGVTVPVLVVPFEGVAPSKALQQQKARTRRGRCGCPAAPVD